MAYVELGRLIATNGVAEAMKKSPSFADFLTNAFQYRYTRNDWGEMDAADLKMNDEALRTGNDRIMASYKFPEANDFGISTDDCIWIITGRDRSVTTILFPSEY